MKMTKESADKFGKFFVTDDSTIQAVINTGVLPNITTDDNNNLILETAEGDKCPLDMDTAAAISNYYCDIVYALADADAIIELGQENDYRCIADDYIDHDMSYLSNGNDKFVQFIKDNIIQG